MHALHTSLAAVLLLFSAATHGQDLKILPEQGKFLGYVAHAEPGKWIVFGPGGFKPVQPQLIDGGKAVIWQGDPGEYAVLYLPPGDAQPVVAVVNLGKPAPDPEPGPDPLPPPTPGQRLGVIVYESKDQGPEFAQLRNKAVKAFEPGRLYILDKDQSPSDTALSRAVQEGRDAGLTLPVLVVISDDADRKTLRVVSCPATVDDLKQELSK